MGATISWPFDNRAQLFEGMTWSTSTVLEETVARARKSGLQLHQLAPLRDIDTLEDLRAEWPRVRSLLGARGDLRRRIEARLGRAPDRERS
jgi:hypothetical protein